MVAFKTNKHMYGFTQWNAQMINYEFVIHEFNPLTATFQRLLQMGQTTPLEDGFDQLNDEPFQTIEVKNTVVCLNYFEDGFKCLEFTPTSNPHN